MRCNLPDLPITWENTQTNFEIRAATGQDLHPLAHLLTTCFYTDRPQRQWLHPFIQLAIREDLSQRLQSTSPYYLCWVAVQSPIPAIPAPLQSVQSVQPMQPVLQPLPTIIGTVEMDLRQPSPWWQSWGCSALGKLDRSYLYLSNLAVCPQFRRQGVASHLLALCEQMARQWYFSQLYLHVLEENPEAKYLYFKGGYERLGTETRWDLLRLQQLRRSLLCKQLQ